MTTKMPNQQTVPTRYASRYIASFRVNIPVEKINLHQWVKDMTDEDYTSYTHAHKAMGSFYKDGEFYTINVENIGTDTLIQHYQLKYHTPGHVQFYSEHTKAYIMRWFPAKVGVPWEMQVRPVSANESELICLVGVDFPNVLLKAAAWLNGLGGLFLRRHLNKEGKAFAKDIEQKFGGLK